MEPTPDDGLGIHLVELGVLSLEMETVVLRGGPMGTRVIVEFKNVRLVGDRIRARQRGGTAADWLVVGPDATATLDIRMTLATDDGALIFVHGGGRTDANTFPKGGAMWFAPIFETADPRYGWLNAIQAIGKGRAAGDHATFRLYEAR